MTNIGAVCLITIGVWIVIELAVQFGKYHHRCVAGISRDLSLSLLEASPSLSITIPASDLGLASIVTV